MGKYSEEVGEKELIVKTSPSNISSNLRNAKNDFSIDKNKYDILGIGD